MSIQEGGAYNPDRLTIARGTTVRWYNYDYKWELDESQLPEHVYWKKGIAHTVSTSSGPMIIESGDIAYGQPFTFTFTTAGTYSYFCRNQFFVGQIVVQ